MYYARTITLKPDTWLTGRVHTTEHIFVLSKGDMTVVTEDGRKRVQAPYQVVCRAGLKRVGYAHSECVCSNIHLTTETDLAKLEAALVEPENLALEAHGGMLWLG